MRLKNIILIAFLALWSLGSQASTYGFGFTSFSMTTGLGGSVTTSVQIPGTFGGIIPADPSQGRYLKSVMIWCDAPAAGDQITLLQVVDTDGLVPSGIRALFPDYPVIFDLLDDPSGATKALMLPGTPIIVEAFDVIGQPTTRFIPSQLYIKMTYQAGGLGLSKTMRTVIRWGIWE